MDDEATATDSPKKVYGKGWKPRAPASTDAPDVPSAARFGAPNNLPSEALDLRSWVLRVNDQKLTSSCVGQAISKAIHVLLRKRATAAGMPEPIEPSSLGIYGPARRREVGPDEPLEDDGCDPRDAMESIRTVGVPSEAAWPFDPARVNDVIPWDVFRDAAKLVVFAWYAIQADGSHRSDAIAQALAHGYPVVFGMRLWQAFEDYVGGTIASIGADFVGGHMLLILGYRTRADGAREFLVLNSWNATWGEDGYCWIHEDVLATDRASDFFALEAA